MPQISSTLVKLLLGHCSLCNELVNFEKGTQLQCMKQQR